jgi:hypothetical protein
LRGLFDSSAKNRECFLFGDEINKNVLNYFLLKNNYVR